MAYDTAPAEKEAALVLTDDDFLSIVAEQRQQAIGFDGNDSDSTLAEDRETALKYIKGQMDDIPNPTNRSTAVTSDVSDAIETALPDLIEIFIGGDDVATFQPLGPEDEEQAKAETEYVSHVIFDQNPGFLLFYTMIKDALSSKLGIAKSWWEDGEEVEETQHEGFSPDAFPLIHAMAEAEGVELSDPVQAEDGTLGFTARRAVPTGCQRNMAVAPEDFAFACDTITLRETSYCAMRSRPRAQDLVADGYDADLIDSLPEYTGRDDTTDQARDTAGESERRPTSSAYRGLRPVEIVEHYVRVDADGDGKPELWKVVTGGGETVFLDKERVEIIPFAAITPYIVTHRLMGRSLADLLIEIQRIKTALLRMLLDSGYFALNQRHEVAMDRANEWTVTDLMRNEPMAPVRSKTGDAVRALGGSGLSFDVTGALEYVSTVAEQRTGIARNAQGLNPDTLHDTASGARQLIAAAQKRVRLIARVFAETGIKDLFLNVHDILRRHGREMDGKQGGQWAKVDPTTWPKRKGLKVEIGVGSGGREHDIAAGQALIAMQAQAVQAQGGLNGPLVTAENIVKSAKRQTERLGFRDGEQYWADPKAWAAQQAQQPPQPDPAMIEAQQKAQLQQQESQAKLQLQAQEGQAQLALTARKQQQDFDLRAREIEGGLALEREQLGAELALKRNAMAADRMMRAAGMGGPGIGADVHPGGEPG